MISRRKEDKLIWSNKCSKKWEKHMKIILLWLKTLLRSMFQLEFKDK